MRSRLASWVLLLYVAIDLANPFVPGAFGFSPEQGLVWVEALPHARATLSVGTGEATDSTPALSPVPAEVERPRSSGPDGAGNLTAWLVGVRTGDPPARDLPPPVSDDH